MKPHTASFSRRLVLMLASIPVMALGVAILTIAGYGNASFGGMCQAIADRFHVLYGTAFLTTSGLLLLVVLLLYRRLIHIGTFVNIFLLGYCVDFYLWLYHQLFPAPNVPVRILLMLAGIGILSFGASLYFVADVGVAPIDAMAFIVEKYTPLPFAVSRILTDSLCIVGIFVFGGTFGIGTALAAVLMGPLISWFNKCVSEPLLYGREKA